MIVRIQFADSLIEIFLFRKRVERTSTFFYQQISLGILTNQNEGFSISTNAMSSFKFRSNFFASWKSGLSLETNDATNRLQMKNNNQSNGENFKV